MFNRLSPSLGSPEHHPLPLEDDMAPVVALGGLLTIKQLFPWYEPLLKSGTASAVPAKERFFPPPQRGLGTVDEMRKRILEDLDEVHDRLGVPMVLAGHSLGGLMSTMVALERPNMVAGVVCLAGAQEGYKKETLATLALKATLRHPDGGRLLRHNSDFMIEHKERMASEWPAHVSLHLISPTIDYLLPAPQGLGIKLPRGQRPEKRMVLPPNLLPQFVAQLALGMPKDTRPIFSAYPTEHILVPRCPEVIEYITGVRRSAVSHPAPSEITPTLHPTALPAAA